MGTEAPAVHVQLMHWRYTAELAVHPGHAFAVHTSSGRTSRSCVGATHQQWKYIVGLACRGGKTGRVGLMMMNEDE